jgi:hypothetical protein
MDIDRIIEIVRTLKEEAPTVSIASGQSSPAGPDMTIAGLVGEPPVGKKKKKPPILARGCMKGARTRWKKGCK